MTHITGESHEAAAADTARLAALRAAQRCAEQGVRAGPRVGVSTPVTTPSVPPLRELQHAVEAYVTALKAAGRPPESTVVLVKQVIAEVDAAPDEADVLRREAVRWTIDAYYAL